MKIKIWKINKLEKICEILDNKRVPISQKDRISGIYPYYGVSGIVDYIDKYIFDEELVLIGEDGAK
ncbi:TPA: restriction endonuclease subunit S [Campylobacter jejuni]|nr:restriction endonuclease subunit S [Campylobacter jejuni]